MKIFRKVAPFFLCIAFIVITPFAYAKTTAKDDFSLKTPTQKMILTLWNIDVFEGGLWSRADFLSSVATKYSKDGVLVMVVSHTVESAKQMIKSGTLPDMISFGVGADFVTEYAKKLPDIKFVGGEINGECFAYPWCAGGYFLIGKNEDNKHIDRLIVSQNAFTLPFGVFAYEQIKAKQTIRKSPLDAYTEFLAGGDDDFLLGTQRDLFRLEKRGVSFYAKPLGEFSDIVQYLSVFATDGDRYGECLNFAKFLTGEKIQSTLDKIGMVSPFYSGSKSQVLSNFDFLDISLTVSPFSNASIIVNIIDDAWQKNFGLGQSVDFKNVLKRL